MTYFCSKLVKFAEFIYNSALDFVRVFIILFTILWVNLGFAQEQADNQLVGSDSVRVDSAASKKSKTSDRIQYQINYASEDSMYFDVKEQIMHLYGKSRVNYGDKTIEADYISIDYGNNVVRSTYTRDSTGKKIGVPLFTDDKDKYNADTIIYNFKTERGYIKGIITEQSGGFISGGETLKEKDNTVYVKNGQYCPCEDPNDGTFFQAKKIKVIPGKRVYTGPGILHIGHIPTPLMLPFGLFPSTDRRSAGLIFPQYGEQQDRGFYLSNMGFYLPVGDYVGLKFLGDYFTKGGGSLTLQSQYKSRYSFDGNFSATYTTLYKEKGGFNEEKNQTYKIMWQHRPISFSGKSFSSDVNFQSTEYSKRNELSLLNNIQTNINSTIKYRAPIRKTPFSYEFNLRHNQNNTTKVMNFDLPEFALNMNQVKPFESDKVGRKSEFRRMIESVNVRYTGNFNNRITSDFNTTNRFGFDVENAEKDTVLQFVGPNVDKIMSNSNYAVKHAIPIGATMKLGPISMNPSFNYTENWYDYKYDYTYSQASNAVRVDTIKGFNRASTYSGGVNFTTRMYGLYSYRGERQKKLRHVVNPNLGFSYSPDRLTDPNLYQIVQTNASGYERYVSRFQGSVYSAPGGAESASINFGVRNDFELKYNKKTDTTGKATYLKILDNVFGSGSYNMVADSFNLSNLSFGANSSLIRGISLRGTMGVNPYTYMLDSINGVGEVIKQHRINSFAWNNGQGLGRIENVGLNLSGSFTPDYFKKKKGQTPPVKPIPQLDPTGLSMYQYGYIDFSIPWRFGFNLNHSLTRTGFKKPKQRTSLSLDGELKVSEFWKVNMVVIYDFQAEKFLSPNINIYRDLGCWEFSVRWVPFGQSQSYMFGINMKSPSLKDMKLSRNKSYITYN